MALCWPLQMSPTQKATLISLADNADDHGSCWPSIPKICERTCLSERAVHGAIKWLESEGFIDADRSNGRHTRYRITLNGDQPPQQMHPRRKCAPATGAVEPPQEMQSPPQHVQSPPQELRSNRQEPSRTVRSNRHSPRTSKPSSERFAEFWDAYPRKVGSKAKAQKTWTTQKLDDNADQILADVRARVADDSQWRDAQFIPYPTTYLNGQRWNDQWRTASKRPAVTDRFSGSRYEGSTDDEIPEMLRVNA
jgi:DNA-binding MarR family transcriptional regulator